MTLKEQLEQSLDIVQRRIAQLNAQGNLSDDDKALMNSLEQEQRQLYNALALLDYGK